MARNVLFVCTGNVDRSPTAEALLKDRKDLEVRSAGTWEGARVMVTEELTSWADTIFVMEERHKEALKRLDPRVEEKIIVLGIEDHYLRDDPALVKVLRERLSKYFGEM